MKTLQFVQEQDELDSLLSDALKNKVIKKEYKININGSEVDVHIENIELRTISKRQQIQFETELLGCGNLINNPPDLTEFEEFLVKIKDEKQREARRANPPKSRAHQKAENFAMMETILRLVPERLKRKDGTPLLRTDEQKEKFAKLIDLDNELFKQIFDIYTDISTENEKVKEKIKN
jgi:hypothetical protein